MFKETIFAITAILSVAAFQPAFAEDNKVETDLSKTAPREKWKNMSDEERQAFHEKRKEKWDAMSKEEKLKTIEERHAERQKRMDEKWNSMSADEKIAFVEKRMQKRAEKHKNGEHTQP